MSALLLTQSVTAIIPGLYASFLGVGGISPYAYSVLPGGAGGSIDSSTGAYTAPSQMGSSPLTLFDTIQVTDNVGAIATSKILIGNPLLLFCDILQSELGLEQGRVYLWDQKIMQPSDAGLYVAVSAPFCKPFGNTNRPNGTAFGFTADQSVNMLATLDVDIISRDSSARDRKEEVVLAFNSQYAQSQQEINSFYIGKLPPGTRFTNLSMVDGAAIPYRYRISVNLQYLFKKSKATPYFDTFQPVQVTTNA